MWDAEGSRDGETCPNCQSTKTITYHYAEGFTELECEACGYQTDLSDLDQLTRFRGELKEKTKATPIPFKKLKA
ncbi:MAG: hypothetical protein KC422_15670 [Trueperaceae bacterium]|nr:hypothetical protein [Trueperaceae bacterium]